MPSRSRDVAGASRTFCKSPSAHLTPGVLTQKSTRPPLLKNGGYGQARVLLQSFIRVSEVFLYCGAQPREHFLLRAGGSIQTGTTHTSHPSLRLLVPGSLHVCLYRTTGAYKLTMY